MLTRCCVRLQRLRGWTLLQFCRRSSVFDDDDQQKSYVTGIYTTINAINDNTTQTQTLTVTHAV